MLKKKYIKVVPIICALFMLSGCLEAMFAGTAGTVMELAKDRPARDAMSDIRIATSIKGSLMKQGFKKLYTKIKIEVIQGRVLLTGTVDQEEDVIKVVEICWSKEGVTEVINELKQDKNSNKFNLMQYTKDTLITSQIKSKTFLNRDVKFVNYTVITMNNVVYLFGMARSEEELNVVADIASNIRGVEEVISHAKVESVEEKVKSKPDDSTNKNDSDGLLIDQGMDDLNLDQGMGDDW